MFKNNQWHLQFTELGDLGLSTPVPDPNEDLQRSLTQKSDRPEPAAIAIHYSLRKNKRKLQQERTSDTKNVSLHDRINQFPDQHLIVRGTKILCDAYKEIVSSKESVLKSYCTSQKHAGSKEKVEKSNLKEQTIAEALSRDKIPKDSTLPLAEQAYRQEEVKEFLKAGIPISKIDKLLSVLEKSSHRPKQ